MSYRHHYRGGDKQDVDHYTNAAIPGCLVTSDRALRDTSSLITWRSFSVIAPEEFLERVRRL